MTDQNSSDESLMRALKKENTQCLRLLINRWEKRLLHFIFRYVQDESVAMDLVQEVFVRIYQSKDGYDEKRKFSTWMFGIAANLCRNHHRWQKRHAGSALESVPEAVDRTTPASQIDDKELVQAVRDGIRRLPHAYRVTVLLYYYEGQSYGEIAEVLNCSIRGVESRLYRARRLLAKRLGLILDKDSRECPDGHNRIRNPASHVFCR